MLVHVDNGNFLPCLDIGLVWMCLQCCGTQRFGKGGCCAEELSVSSSTAVAVLAWLDRHGGPGVLGIDLVQPAMAVLTWLDRHGGPDLP